MFLVDPGFLGQEICEERFAQLASVINSRVYGEKKSVEKCRISVARGCFIKYYLWRKIEVDTLYFSANSQLTTPRIIACKNQNIVNLPELIHRCHLYSLFALKLGCIIGCITLFTPTVVNG